MKKLIRKWLGIESNQILIDELLQNYNFLKHNIDKIHYMHETQTNLVDRFSFCKIKIKQLEEQNKVLKEKIDYLYKELEGMEILTLKEDNSQELKRIFDNNTKDSTLENKIDSLNLQNVLDNIEFNYVKQKIIEIVNTEKGKLQNCMNCECFTTTCQLESENYRCKKWKQKNT